MNYKLKIKEVDKIRESWRRNKKRKIITSKKFFHVWSIHYDVSKSCIERVVYNLSNMNRVSKK